MILKEENKCQTIARKAASLLIIQGQKEINGNGSRSRE